MFRPVPTLLGLAVASAAASGPAQEVSVSGEDCEVIRILEDGREVRSTAKAKEAGGTASASARSGGGSSRSSVSVSSSSQGGGSARGTSSATDAEGRTVTTTHDENGCTIVIDERGS